MAVSKTQNERPAIIALIDEVNDLAESSGEQSEDISSMQQSIESMSEDVASSLSVTERIKTGIAATFSIPAQSTQNKTFTYDEPFASGEKVLVLIGVVNDVEQVYLDAIVIQSTNTGFIYDVINNDESDDVTVTVGYIAIQVS